jgi:hypothetical protein
MQQMSDREPSPHTSPSPTDASDVVVQVTEILGDYLSTDSRFTPEMAVERVRTVVNSKAGMSAFVQDALRPGEVSAGALVATLARALDEHGPAPEKTVLRLIDIIESPRAVDVFDRAMQRRKASSADQLH